MRKILGRVRPNILMLELGIVAVAILSIMATHWELAGVCAGGLIGFGNQLLEKEK